MGDCWFYGKKSTLAFSFDIFISRMSPSGIRENRGRAYVYAFYKYQAEIWLPSKKGQYYLTTQYACIFCG
jgi:hypothetical protein